MFVTFCWPIKTLGDLILLDQVDVVLQQGCHVLVQRGQLTVVVHGCVLAAILNLSTSLLLLLSIPLLLPVRGLVWTPIIIIIIKICKYGMEIMLNY